MPLVRVTQANNVQRRVVTTHSRPDCPRANAAIANAKGMEKAT